MMLVKERSKKLIIDCQPLLTNFNCSKEHFGFHLNQSYGDCFQLTCFQVDEEQELFEEIIEDMRDNIQKQVQERDYFDVPITWFIFLLKIQKLCQLRKISYISYQEAVDVWMDQKVSEKEMTATPDEDQHVVF